MKTAMLVLWSKVESFVFVAALKKNQFVHVVLYFLDLLLSLQFTVSASS